MLSLFFVPLTVPSGRTSRKWPFLHCSFLFRGSKSTPLISVNRKTIVRRRKTRVFRRSRICCKCTSQLSCFQLIQQMKTDEKYNWSATALKCWLCFAVKRNTWEIKLNHSLYRYIQITLSIYCKLDCKLGFYRCFDQGFARASVRNFIYFSSFQKKSASCQKLFIDELAAMSFTESRCILVFKGRHRKENVNLLLFYFVALIINLFSHGEMSDNVEKPVIS